MSLEIQEVLLQDVIIRVDPTSCVIGSSSWYNSTRILSLLFCRLISALGRILFFFRSLCKEKWSLRFRHHIQLELWSPKLNSHDTNRLTSWIWNWWENVSSELENWMVAVPRLALSGIENWRENPPNLQRKWASEGNLYILVCGYRSFSKSRSISIAYLVSKRRVCWRDGHCSKSTDE